MASVAKRSWIHNGETKTKWVVRYTDQGGTRRMKTFPSKKTADRYGTQVETEIWRVVWEKKAVTVQKKN